MIGNRCVLVVSALNTIGKKEKKTDSVRSYNWYIHLFLIAHVFLTRHLSREPPFPAPLYAVQSLLTASVTPTSLVSNEYSATPTSTVPARRAQLAAARVLGTRFLGK